MSAVEWATEAQNLQAKGEFADALQLYLKVIEVAPNIAEIHLNIGCCQSALHKSDEALSSFNRAIELVPSLGSAHCNKGNILKAKKQYKEALESFKEATVLEPSMKAAWYGLSVAQNALGDFDSAISSADKALAVGSTSVESNIPCHNERAFALVRLGRGAEAYNNVKAVLAERDYDACDPTAQKLYNFVCSAKIAALMKKGDYNRAQKLLVTATKRQNSMENWFNLGICQSKNKDLDGALESFKNADATPGTTWKVKVALATVLMAKQKFEDAVISFMEALVYPEAENDPDVLMNLSVALLQLRRDDEAVLPLDRLIKLEPDNWRARSMRGTVAITMKDFKTAKDHLEHAITTKSGAADTTVLYNLGFAYFSLGLLPQAHGAFQESVNCDAGNQEAAQALQSLAPLAELSIPPPTSVKASRRRSSSRKSSTSSTKRASKSGPDKETTEERRRSSSGSQASTAAITKAVNKLMSPEQISNVVLAAPQRPQYMRRNSMKNIKVGVVDELAEKFDSLFMRNIHEHREV